MVVVCRVWCCEVFVLCLAMHMLCEFVCCVMRLCICVLCCLLVFVLGLSFAIYGGCVDILACVSVLLLVVAL